MLVDGLKIHELNEFRQEQMTINETMHVRRVYVRVCW